MQEHIWVNAKGLRVGSRCPDAQSQEIALWPAPLEPWLPKAERRETRLPPADPDCPPQNLNLAPPLSIVGVREGDNLRLPASSRQAPAPFIDGAPLADTYTQQDFTPTLNKPGRYQLSVLDESGQTARVEFSVVE